MSTHRPLLRVIETPVVPGPTVNFCGHCGEVPPPADPAPRVCDRCGLGVVLSAPENVAPSARTPFLVIDSRLSICAVSRLAEDLLQVSEVNAINRHLTDFILPADAEVGGPESLVGSIIAAAGGSVAPHDIVVRPAGEYGVRYLVRVGPCGPPTAALIVFSEDAV